MEVGRQIVIGVCKEWHSMPELLYNSENFNHVQFCTKTALKGVRVILGGGALAK